VGYAPYRSKAGLRLLSQQPSLLEIDFLPQRRKKRWSGNCN